MKITKQGRKILLSVVLVTALFFILYGKSAYALCLDVRDYGYHTYSARVSILREWRIETNRVDGYIGNSPVTYHFYAIYQDRLLECICGKQLRENQFRAGDDMYIEWH